MNSEIARFLIPSSDCYYSVLDICPENDPNKILYQLTYNGVPVVFPGVDPNNTNSAEFIKNLVDVFQEDINDLYQEFSYRQDDVIIEYQSQKFDIQFSEESFAYEYLTDDVLNFEKLAEIEYQYNPGDPSVGIQGGGSWVIGNTQGTALEYLLKNNQKLQQIKDLFDLELEQSERIARIVGILRFDQL